MTQTATFPVRMSGTTKVNLWADEASIEEAALAQLRAADAHPDVVEANVMPDVHFGKGFTVGSVIAMREAVSPAAVGVDIGCGVAAVQTGLRVEHLEDLPALRSAIEAAIPVGFHSYDDADHLPASYPDVRAHLDRFDTLTVHDKVADREARARQQCGTLGGGNHFIELCADGAGSIWLTLHSGSRNIGKTIADIHISTAKGLEHNEGFGDMAVFRGGTAEMGAYLNDLHWAQDYAAASRAVMMFRLRGVVTRHFLERGRLVNYGTTINVHHNYVSRETRDGEELVVTRKGAIRAGAGELALIPGSMGTGSYIVRGLGNPASFYSASHGAGRVMSRTKAKKQFTAADLAAQTEGIECRKDEGVVDEIPAAYKDLAGVIAAQADLIQPVAHLRTLLCVKG